MNYDMMKPCDLCPFRKDVKGLALDPERAREFGKMMLDGQGGEFPCHKTADLVDGEFVDGGFEKTSHCAGALIFAEKNGRATQMMRIAERLGLYDHTKLSGKEQVFDSLSEMVKVNKKRQNVLDVSTLSVQDVRMESDHMAGKSTVLTLRFKRGSLVHNEFQTVIVELSAHGDSDELRGDGGKRRLMGEWVEAHARPRDKYRQGLQFAKTAYYDLPVAHDTVVHLEELAGELWHFGDPKGDWIEELQPRCAPFRKMARRIFDALFELQGHRRWVNDVGAVLHSKMAADATGGVEV